MQAPTPSVGGRRSSPMKGITSARWAPDGRPLTELTFGATATRKARLFPGRSISVARLNIHHARARHSISHCEGQHGVPILVKELRNDDGISPAFYCQTITLLNPTTPSGAGLDPPQASGLFSAFLIYSHPPRFFYFFLLQIFHFLISHFLSSIFHFPFSIFHFPFSQLAWKKDPDERKPQKSSRLDRGILDFRLVACHPSIHHVSIDAPRVHIML